MFVAGVRVVEFGSYSVSGGTWPTLRVLPLNDSGGLVTRVIFNFYVQKFKKLGG